MIGYHFDKDRHIHTLDGIPLMGVTTVLSVIAKPALIQWAANQAIEYIKLSSGKVTNIVTEDTGHYEVTKDILEEARTAHAKKKDTAGRFGKNVHEAIENWVKNRTSPEGLSDTEQKAFDNFILWARTHGVEFLESELNLHSREMWLGGICDLVLEIDGKKYIGDIKTSSAIYPEHFIQCAAYADMLKEKYPDIHGMVIINLQKSGKLDHKFNYDIKGNFEAFKAALTLHKFLKNEKK